MELNRTIGLDCVRQSNTIEPNNLCDSSIAFYSRTQSNFVERSYTSLKIDKIFEVSLKRPSHGKLKLAHLKKVGKLVPSHVKLASNQNTLICNMADVVQWHSHSVATCVSALLTTRRPVDVLEDNFFWGPELQRCV